MPAVALRLQPCCRAAGSRALQDCALPTSLHGRPLQRVVRHLRPGARIVALSWDGTTPAQLASLLAAERGMGRSVLTVCESLGGPRERLRQTSAAEFALEDIDPLNTIAVEIIAEPGARIIPSVTGLSDDWFEHDGQITRREIRAITLASLAPRPGERLWDIGAGSGSISIEWSCEMVPTAPSQSSLAAHRAQCGRASLI